MRNDTEPKIRKIVALIQKLPSFTLDTLASVEDNKTYLKIFFWRYKKTGKLIGLKKGVYTSGEYINEIQKKGRFPSYLEYLANNLYLPSYLSLDYILYQHNLLTEMPVNFTSMTSNKTTHFVNKLGNFFYHKIKSKLFLGFEVINEGDFLILKATKAKALFDFIYLRKSLLVNEKAAGELRLNLENMSQKETREFKNYIKLENSKKMKQISHWLFK